MTLEDPYFTVKEDVETCLIHAQELYSHYLELREEVSATNQEQEWLLTELRNTLRSSEWDLEDLEETLKIVEKNRNTFKLRSQDLAERKRFINESKGLVHEIKEKMAGTDPRFKDRSALLSSGTGFGDSPGQPRSQYKYSRLLENEEASTSNFGNQFVGESLEQQQLIMQSQDDSLEKIGSSVHVLKDMSSRIGGELDEQALMLDDLGRDMDRTDSKLDTVMKKLAKVTHMSNDRRQWIAIGVLIVILVIVIALLVS